ncbi:MAG TPA: TolC family protein [Polyangiaceae bacterium]|nr:TolC family protein [Polyangiaceae bacterium]
MSDLWDDASAAETEEPGEQAVIHRRVGFALVSGLAWISALPFATGCVSENAGYDDVRKITSERIAQQVHWRGHDSQDDNSDAETQKLLQKPLTADDAVQVALLNNAALQGAFENLGVARGQLLHAFRLPNPTVGAAVRFGAEARPEIDVDAMLSLSEFLFMPWRKSAANADFDATKLLVAQRAVDLAFQTRGAFFGYQAAAQQLELERTVLQSLRASANAAQAQHQAGNVTDLTLANEQALYEEARIAYARAEEVQIVAREQLNALMGLWGKRGASWQAATHMTEPLPSEPLLSNLEQRAIENNLPLQLSQKKFEAAGRTADLSSLEGWVPDLKGGISAERREGGWGLGPRAELEIPLFYQGQGERAIALAEMRRERKVFEDTTVQVRARARALAARLAAAERNARFYQATVLPLRQTVVNETQLEYNAMGVGVFQLLQAKRDQISAAKAYVDLLHDYWATRTQVEQLLAGSVSLPGWAPESASTSSPP